MGLNLDLKNLPEKADEKNILLFSKRVVPERIQMTFLGPFDFH